MMKAKVLREILAALDEIMAGSEQSQALAKYVKLLLERLVRANEL